MMPAILLSGFPSPVENMPVWLQALDWFNPLRHFIVIVKGVFIKGIGPAILWQSLWPLLVIALLTASLRPPDFPPPPRIAPLVWCLTIGWWFAASDFGLPLAACRT